MTVCRIPGCERGVHYGGLCRPHRYQEGVGPRIRRPPALSPEESLQWLLDHRTVPAGDHRLWTGGTTRKRGRGYPRARIADRSVLVHRAVYAAEVGPLADWETVHHKCGESLCLNPDHLQKTTQRENLAEMLTRRALEARIDHLEKALARCQGADDPEDRP